MDVAKAYRTAMRGFAERPNLDVWYARLDEDRMLERTRSELPAERARALERNMAKARRKNSLRALDLLTEEVDGELRIKPDPPVVVPAEHLRAPGDTRDLGELMEGVIAQYYETLPPDRRRLMEGYRFVDLARKVVGVGSVGLQAWVVLLLGRDHGDPLFLQVKEAGPSVIEPYTGAAGYACHGQRVVEGQRLMQAASDILLGWLSVEEGFDHRSRDFYVRQLWDAKRSAAIETMDARGLALYAEICGWTLARAHARSGDRMAIAAYLGSGDRFDRALAEFAELYADQTERDHAAFLDAIAAGRLQAESL